MPAPWEDFQNQPTREDVGPWTDFKNVPPVSGNQGFDQWFAQTSNGRFLDAFGQGARDGWGAEPLGISKEAEDWLKKAGIFDDYANGQRSLVKQFNEAIIRPTALLGETAWRALSAGIVGAQSGLTFIGQEVAKKNEETGRPDVAASSKGAYQMLATIPEFIGAGFKQLAGIPHPPAVPAPDIAKARTLGVIGEGEAGYMGTAERKPVDPDILAAEATKVETEAAPKVPEPDTATVSPAPVEPAPDINTMVRQANPALFNEYDALSTRRDTFARWMRELRDDAQEKAAAPFTPEITDLTARLEDATPRLAKKYQARLDELTAQRDAAVADALRTESPDLTRVRQAYQEADFRMRDLAPDVSAAYRDAEARIGPINETRSAVPEQVAPEQVPEQRPAEQAPAHEAAPEVAPEQPKVTQEAVQPEAAAPEPAQPTAEPAPPKYVAEISNDVTRKLTEAGRPEEEARAAGQIISAYYETRAARFGGQRGTAADLYNAEAPEIRAGRVAVRQKELAQKKGGKELEQPARPEDRQRFESELKKADARAIPARQELRVSGVPRALQALGVPLNDLRMPQSVLAKIRQNHGLDEGAIRRLPDLLADPVMVLDSATHPGTHVLVLDAVDAQGRPLIAAVHPSPARGVPNILASVYGKDNAQAWLDREVAAGRLRYADKTKTATWARKSGLQLPGSGPSGGKGKLLTRADLVKLGGEFEQSRRGKISIAPDGKKIITLFKDADASTFIHETGHQFLEDLIADSQHPLAPGGLKADAKAVRDWLGVKEGEDIPTRAHEKFARGFERYMMEGVAPSKALARVFAQFRDWLTRIYQSVKALKAPISDDIRGVFDRLLSEKPERTVIAPERKTPSLGDIHTAEAESAAPADAGRVREAIRQEADDYAITHVPELTDELGIRERPNPEGNQGQGAEADRNGPQGQPEPTGNGSGEGTGAVGPGGGETSPEGARSRARPTEPPAGPNERFAEPESGLVDKAGNIRLDNLGAPEDVNAVIREAAELNDEFRAARRGVVTDAQVLDLADALGMTPESLSARKIGQAFNAEQIMAARKLLVQSATEVRDAMARAASGTDANVMAYAQAKARHQMIQEQVAGITAEAGRALRAFRAIEGVKDAQQLGDFLQQNTGKTLFQLRREAQLGMSLDTPQKVSKFINDSKKPKFSDMVIEFWINALLSGPLTHIKNMIGNMGVAVGSIAETGGAAAIGAVRRAITGADDGVRFGEARARLFGLVQGSVEGVRAAAEAFKNEQSMTGTLQNEQRRFQTIPGTAGKVIRVPTRLLGAEDEFFKAIAARQEINALAERIATEEGLLGQAKISRIAELSLNPTEAMLKEAQKNAVYQTFQKNLGPTGRAIQQFANSHPLAKVVIPFIRTPTNLIKYAGERSPLGLFSEEVRANLSGRNGAAARDTQLARVVMGTTVGLAVLGLTAQGLITGGGPSDPKERAALRLTGWQPYSLKIGDAYYSYAWLDPFSTVMGVSADLYDVGHYASTDDAEFSKTVSMFFGSITKNIMGKLSLRGASDLIQALTDPDRYGPRYVQNLSGTIVPSVIAQTAREMDPLERDARTTLDAIKARIPGLRETLLPRRDVWGEPIQNLESLGPDAISPISMSAISNDPVNQALMRLRIYPSRVGRTIRGVELTDQQYDDYARISGRLAKIRLDAIVKGPGFNSMPANIQHDLIVNTISHAREAARTQIMIQNPSIVQAAIDAKTEPLRTGELRSKGPAKQSVKP